MDQKALAQMGAAIRVRQILAELEELRRLFPPRAGRRVQGGGAGGTTVPADSEETPQERPKRRGRPPLSAEERRAASLRMKAYWAARRDTKK